MLCLVTSFLTDSPLEVITKGVHMKHTATFKKITDFFGFESCFG